MPTFTPIEEHGQRRRPRFVPAPGIPEVIAPQPQGAPVSGSEAFSRGGTERLLGNLTGLVGRGADALGFLQAVNPSSLLARMGGVDLPAPITGRSVPSGEQAAAGIESGIGGITGLLGGEAPQFGGRFEDALERQRRAEAERPGAFGGGQVAGDVASLMTGRAPFARGIGQAERRLLAARTSDELAQLSPGAQRLANKVWNSTKLRTLARGVGRAGETGVEGAVLAAAQGGDPLEVAALGAGGQAFGSAALGLGKTALGQVPGGLGFKLVAGAAVTGGLIQLLKSATPGGQDFSLESLESGFDKTVVALALGGLTAAAGAGRLRGPGVAEDLPKVFDAITTLPRGAMLSVVRDWVNADSATKEATEATLERLKVDPDWFGAQVSRKLRRAMNSEDGNLPATVSELMDSDEFQSRLRAPIPDLSQRTQELVRDDVRADTKNARLPSSSEVAKRLGGDPESTAPRAFIRDRLRDKGRVKETLSGLPRRARLDALEVNLAGLIGDSTRRVEDRRVLDGAKLRAAWDRLPPETRGAYSEAQQDSINRFIDAAEGSELSVVPPLAAHSLMLANGRLSRRLRGKE